MRENWEIVPFERSIQKVKYTTKVPSSDYLPVGAFPIVSQEEGLISGYWDNEADVFHHNKPVVIFGDHTRIIKYVDFDFVLGADGVKILLPVEGLSAKFLSYYLRWYKVPSLGYSRHFKLLKEASVPIPPAAEQEKIVAELDCLTGIIEKKKQQLEELDKLAQSIFYDMFGDPITNEKSWKQKSLGEICTKITDGSHNPPRGISASPFRMISSQNITDEGIVYQAVRFLSKEDYLNENKRTNIQLGDVLLTIVGTIGRTCVVSPNDTGITLQRSVAVLRSDSVAPVFLKHFLVGVRAQLEEEAHGVAQKGIYLKQLAKTKTIIPPRDLQNEFAQKIEAIEKQKELVKRSIVETETLFNSRMDYWFN